MKKINQNGNDLWNYIINEISKDEDCEILSLRSNRIQFICDFPLDYENLAALIDNFLMNCGIDIRTNCWCYEIADAINEYECLYYSNRYKFYIFELKKWDENLDLNKYLVEEDEE